MKWADSAELGFTDEHVGRAPAAGGPSVAAPGFHKKFIRLIGSIRYFYTIIFYIFHGLKNMEKIMYCDYLQRFLVSFLRRDDYLKRPSLGTNALHNNNWQQVTCKYLGYMQAQRAALNRAKGQRLEDDDYDSDVNGVEPDDRTSLYSRVNGRNVWRVRRLLRNRIIVVNAQDYYEIAIASQQQRPDDMHPPESRGRRPTGVL